MLTTNETASKANDWRLQAIELKFNTWGEHEGKYSGKISFQNGDHESFSFKIRPDMAEKYISVLSADIVASATDLGSRLLDSLGLTPPL